MSYSNFNAWDQNNWNSPTLESLPNVSSMRSTTTTNNNDDDLNINDRRKSKDSTKQKAMQTQFKISKPALSAGNYSANPRAVKACNGCRKKKTRCFTIENPKIAACSRCKSLGIICSFEEDLVKNGKFKDIEELRNYENSQKVVDTIDNYGKTQSLELEKLDSIHEDVKKLVRYMMFSNGNSGISTNREMPQSVLASNNKYYDSNIASQAMNVNHTIKVNNNNSTDDNHESSVPKLIQAQLLNDPQIDMNEDDDQPKMITPSTMIPLSYLTSPFNILKESPPDSLLPFSITNLLNPMAPRVEKDIVTLKFITKTEAYSLLNIFRDKYGKWISLKPNTTTDELLNEFRKDSPLLLDVCCLVALRSSKNNSLKKKVTKLLAQRIANSLSKQILTYPSTDLKFISTLTLLSVYGYTLSLPNDFNIDPWFYSGIALKHFITSINYNPSFINATITVLPDSKSQFDLLTYMRVYDHLLVTHLFNCIVSGRTCSIDRIRLNKIRSKLDIVYAGIFDGKITAEVYLCDIVYDFFVRDMSNDLRLLNFKKVIKKLDDWYKNWSYLIKQPIPQLLEFLFNFYSLLIYYHVNFQLFFNELNLNILNNTDGDNASNDDEFDDLQKLFTINPTNFETFSNVLTHISIDHLDKMWYNCLKVINELLSFVNKSNLDNIIDNSEQFEYFSDQIHFSLFFSIIVFLRLMDNYFKKNNSPRSSSIPLLPSSDTSSTFYNQSDDFRYNTNDNKSKQNFIDNELKNEYISYFNENFEDFDVTKGLKKYILKSDQLAIKQPLHNMDKPSFVQYMTQILIVIKKYQMVSNDIINVNYYNNDNERENNVFYRYFFTLKQNIKQTFQDIEIDHIFED